MLSIIVAYDQHRGIGIKNKLPWHLRDDLKRFKQITSGHYIVMGRKTFESIGYPLSKRNNIILTRQIDYQQKKCMIMNSAKKIISLANKIPKKSIFIIGGAEVYRFFLQYADRLYITNVKTKIHADAFFPYWNQFEFRRINVSSYQSNQVNDYNFDCEIWERTTSDINYQ